jgi:outer membrane protein assembly factor BamB
LKHRSISRLTLTALIVLAALTLTACGGQAPATAWYGLTPGDGVVYLAATAKAYAINLPDGTQKWPYEHKVQQTSLFGSGAAADPMHAQPAVGNGLVYFGTDGGYLVAVDATTGAEKCSFVPEAPTTFIPFIKEKPSPVYAGPVLAGSRVIFAGTSNNLYALKATGCESNWKADWQFDVGSRVWGTPLVVENTVYISTLGHKLIALDVDTGKPRWVFDKPMAALAGSPTFSDGTLYVGSFDNHLYAVDAASGSMQWSFDAKNWIWEGPAVVSGTLYFGDVTGDVYALDAATQKPVWTVELPKLQTPGGAVRATPLYADGVLYVGTDNGTLFALDTTTGKERWPQPFKVPSARFLTTPLMEDGLLLVAPVGVATLLYGLNPANAQTQWQFPTPSGK